MSNTYSNLRALFEDLEQDESKQFLKGSAKLALEASPSFHRYIFIESNQDKITPEFFQMLSGLMAQVVDSDQDPELVTKFKEVNRQVLRYSMQSNLQGD